MIDFSKLNDPAEQEKARIERERESELQAQKEMELKTAVEKCLRSIDSLSERERSFIRSCRHRLTLFGVLTTPQEAWLKDIANKVGQ